MKLDTVTLEVLRNALPAVANEIEMALRQNAGLIADRFLENGGPEADADAGSDLRY